jgi:predicted nucleic acid-binding protein
LIRAVVDPSVLVSAFIGNPEAGPGRLITAWRDRRFVLVTDPDDHYLVALSREAEADYLVSVDHDLLDAELDLPVVDPAVFVAQLHDPGAAPRLS